MNPIYIPILSALGGAIIGSLSSIAAIFVQARLRSGESAFAKPL
jgi:hypothetical protein